MLTRRDQLLSYQFMIQRVTSALTGRETDPLTPPFRRFLVAGYSSLIAACVVAAAFGIYGLISPGGNESWRAGDQVILERETGAQYIWRAGRLYRVANYTSGVLLLGRNNGTVAVSRASLLGVPRGAEIGIKGAPNGLPPADKLLGTPWTLCSRMVTDSSDTDQARTVLLVGARAGGGAPAGRDTGFLASNTETGDLYLITRGHRHEITDVPAAMAGLALSQEPRVRTGSAWLDALPAGVDLAPMSIPDRASRSAYADARVGQLFVVSAAEGEKQYYVAVPDGLRPVSEVEFALLFASDETRRAYPDGMPDSPKEIRAADAAAATVGSGPKAGPEQLPRHRPAMSAGAAPGATVCASYGPDGAPAIRVGARLPVSPGELATARRTDKGTVLADRVLIAPGQGALVETVQGDSGPGVVQLITEQGVRYPLASPKVAETLGYSLDDVVRLPAGIVTRVPEGVALDPAAAGTVLLSN
jgi:type VII secretion protein EccB